MPLPSSIIPSYLEEAVHQLLRVDQPVTVHLTFIGKLSGRLVDLVGLPVFLHAKSGRSTLLTGFELFVVP